MYYILVGKQVTKVEDFTTCGLFFGEEFRRVAETFVGRKKENIRVSTVFLGIDHNHWGLMHPEAEQRPIVFETMVFGGSYDLYQQRYCTWDEAEEGHNQIVHRIEMSRLVERKRQKSKSKKRYDTQRIRSTENKQEDGQEIDLM